MKTITEREFHRDPAEVLEALEAGEAFRVTRGGEEVVELQPPTYGQRIDHR